MNVIFESIKTKYNEKKSQIKIARGDKKILKLKAGLNDLTNVPEELYSELSNCEALLENIKETASQDNSFSGWSETYKDLGNSANSLRKKIKALKSDLYSDASEGRPTVFEAISDTLKKLTSWVGKTPLGEAVQKAVILVTNLDAALADLKMTSQMSSRELNDIYYTANDVAKQTGITTKEVIEQAAAWSRLGFHTSQSAGQMAEYSAILAAISPGLDLDAATSGLAAVMKAFDMGWKSTDEVADGILSKINAIGSAQLADNNDIVDFLTSFSEAMADADNTLEDTIALGAGMMEITGNAAEAGEILSTVSMQLRNLSSEAGNLTGGISIFSDEAQTKYKSTRQLLQEISEIYGELAEGDQALLADALSGGRNEQEVAALLNNFGTVTAGLKSMEHSAGSAEAELAEAMDSIVSKMNIMKETGTGIAQNLFGRDELKAVLDIINSLGNALDWLTERMGPLGSIGAGAGLYASMKNVGRLKMSGLICC